MKEERVDGSKQWRFGIVLDAGSSGTRLYIYRWLENSHAREIGNEHQLQSLPAIETKKKWTKKIKPGISTFSDKPEQVGTHHLKELFERAKDVIPKHAASETPIFLLATAGMRLLPQNKQDRIMQEVCAYVRSSTTFLLPDCDAHVRVIPGDVEGLYGWLAANYLLDGFAPQQGPAGEMQHRTFGFLDMGGASAQIAFAPNATEAERHANDLTLIRLRTVNGEPLEHRLFTTTWLRFGVNEARVRYVEALEKSKETENAKILLDPCLPVGLETTPKGDVHLPDDKTIDGKTPVLQGTGKFDECLKTTQPLLEKDHVCEDDPCLVAGVHVPAIDFDVNHFVGVSEYWHTTHDIFQIGAKDKAYDFNTYQQRVSKFCNQDWQDIKNDLEKHKWGDKVDEKTAVEVCFKASWLINVLHEGIGVPRVGVEKTPNTDQDGTPKLHDKAKDAGFVPSFRPVNKIDDTELSWTLGKIVLYASSLIEPSKQKALPVGFGSNVAGTPPDFQQPSIPLQHSPTNVSIGVQRLESGGQLQGASILGSKSSRRVPGILLFLLILCFAVYFLLVRSRRKRPNIASFKSPGGDKPSGRSFLGRLISGLFRRSSHSGAYKQVDVEDGNPLAAPENFELGGYLDDEGSSDSSYGSHRAGRSSGWSSPTRSRMSKGSAEKSVTGLDALGSGQGLGIGLNANAMDSTGLVGRVGSKEQLGDFIEGDHKSRSGSPARRSASRLGKLVED